MMKITCLITSLLFTACMAAAQPANSPAEERQASGGTVRIGELSLNDPYLLLDAAFDDPVYTTYAAAMERSRLYGDKAYKMNYYSPDKPLSYAGDQAGEFFAIWMVNKVAIDKTGQFYRRPVVKASFPDMALLEYQPVKGLHVSETFLVYSSSLAIADLQIRNTTGDTLSLKIYPVLNLGNDSLRIRRYTKGGTYILEHRESRKRLISNLYAAAPYPTETRDLFTMNVVPDSHGGYRGNMDDFYVAVKTDYYSEDRYNDSLNLAESGYVDFVALQTRFELAPGESRNIRYFRGWQDQKENADRLQAEIEKLKGASLQPFLDANVRLFSRVPRIDFKTPEEKMVYLSAFNLARGSMLPPEGKTSHNYYVFSRNPLWGWGHGHQVLHESLSMLAYAWLDPQSAQGSQRVYMEQQGEDGLIAYRHGPRGAQDYPHKGMPTTSAPFFSWINWEVYQVSEDRVFLEEAYRSGSHYVEWLIKNRDTDGDGTFEWGPYGIIENVRDWYNVVFQVSKERYLDVDKEDISDDLECLDLSVMVIKEMRSLSKMASALGKQREAKRWQKQADRITELVNERMWDEESEFYYHVNKEDHSFKYLSRDLRRKEIIGFLPLWAEAAPPERAEKLVKQLLDTTTFWRQYGVPTLSARDEWYSADVDYCCKWNGPVWLLWDYMVYDGLRNYGYHEVASELAGKMMLAVKTQLSLNHNFWESYSPDNTVLNSPSNYIWDAIMARLLIDEYLR